MTDKLEAIQQTSAFLLPYPEYKRRNFP